MPDTEELTVPPVEGWGPTILRAMNRNLPWQDMVCELVDNARAFAKPNQSAVVRVEWRSGRGRDKEFRVIDYGVGSTDPVPFVQAGGSGGVSKEGGNSTFGTGLFAVECAINGEMSITSRRGESGMQIRRTIDLGENSHVKRFAGESLRHMQSLCGLGVDGTAVRFTAVKPPIPTAETVEKLAHKFGEVYADEIRTDRLRLTLVRNGEEWGVVAAGTPAMVWSETASFDVGGHTFAAEWGVTKEENSQNGVAIVYGGKVVTVTPIPCGDYALNRFWGRLVVPRTCGVQVMDLLKRDVSRVEMAGPYERCSQLFEVALKESDELSARDDDVHFIRELELLLCGNSRRGHRAGDAGNLDIRDYHGRSPEGEGVQPRHTGIKRKGKKGGKPNKHDSPSVHWSPLDTEGVVSYDVDTARLTFNTNNDEAVWLRDAKQTTLLAALGNAEKAHRLCVKSESGGFADFGYVLAKYMKHTVNGMGRSGKPVASC